MSNTRPFPRLDDLAFKALLRNNIHGITPNSQLEYDVLFQYKIKVETPLFLQAIADGDQYSAMDLLEANPLLALLARGTVTTYSGYTIKDVTAVQLAYVLDDYEMLKIMLPHLYKLANGVEKASQQINQKFLEVKKQESEFSHYNYTTLINAISADLQLLSSGIANTETEKALAEFKGYFKPGIVNKGRPFNMNHLIKSYQIYHDHWTPWAGGQLLWFVHNVIAYLHLLTPTNYFPYDSNNDNLMVFLNQIFHVETFHGEPIALLKDQHAAWVQNHVDKKRQACEALFNGSVNIPELCTLKK